jgi:hypothetical protein
MCILLYNWYLHDINICSLSKNVLCFITFGFHKLYGRSTFLAFRWMQSAVQFFLLLILKLQLFLLGFKKIVPHMHNFDWSFCRIPSVNIMVGYCVSSSKFRYQGPFSDRRWRLALPRWSRGANLTPSCCIPKECKWLFWSAATNWISVLNASAGRFVMDKRKLCTPVNVTTSTRVTPWALILFFVI